MRISDVLDDSSVMMLSILELKPHWPVTIPVNKPELVLICRPAPFAQFVHAIELLDAALSEWL